MNFQNSPRYMKALQKLARMGPDQRAIFDAAILHGQFADEDMRRMLMGMRDASTNLARERQLSTGAERLGLRRRAFRAGTGLRKRERKFLGRQRVGSEILAGAGAVTDFVLGYRDLENKKRLAKKYRNLIPYIYSGLGGK